MKVNIYFPFRLLLGVLVMFLASSCEKALLEDADLESDGATAPLTLTTRAGDDDSGTATIREGRIYIFNSSNVCVVMLSIDEEHSSVSTQLKAGDYTIYAVGSDDISRFSLPSQSEAHSHSIVKPGEGKVLDELFILKQQVTMEAGKAQNLNLLLQRKVICIDEVEIKDVPTDIQNVEVTLSSFNTTVYLDGTFPTSPVTDYKITLQKQSDGTTWKATANKILFPSAGEPTISVSFTSDNNTDSYAYNIPDALVENRHYSFSATFKTSTAKLTATMIAEDWDDNQDVNFEFDDQNTIYVNPVAGEFINGYYVVSVDDEARTAVLLAQRRIDYEEPAANSDQSVWEANLNTAMAALAKPANVTSNWRIPTIDEATIFTQDTQVVKYANDVSGSYFCYDGATLKWCYFNRRTNVNRLINGTAQMSSIVMLRPVIDINY